MTHSSSAETTPPPTVRVADPESDALPEALRPRAHDPPVLLLLDNAENAQWAARLAIAIAGAWTGGGRRVVLADLHLEDPRLHEYLGEPNLDGVVDTFLYGASLARTARPTVGHGFYLIPAGTYTADVSALYHHPRWDKIVAGFAEANAALVVFAPPSAFPLAERFGASAEIVFFGEPLPLPEARSRVRAIVLPAEREMAPVLPPPPEDRTLQIAIEPLSPLPEADFGDATVEQPPPRKRKHGQRGASPLLWAGMVALGLAAAAVWFFRERPEMLPFQAETAPSSAARDAIATRVAGSVGVPLAYSVQVKAFDALQAARDEVARNRRRVSDTPFFVSPERIDGILYHRVMGGMLPDTAAAAALRDRLVEAGVIDAEDASGGAWSLIRDAPLAFGLGGFATRAQAEARADSLFDRGVPAYAVAVPLADGTERWQLYGGAFLDSTSAEGMGEILAAARLPARLERRVGRPPVMPAGADSRER